MTGALLLAVLLLAGWKSRGVPRAPCPAIATMRRCGRCSATGSTPARTTPPCWSVRRATSSTCSCRSGSASAAFARSSCRLVGTSPAFALGDLAEDPAFHGTLLVDVAPDLFFTGFENKSGFAEYRRRQSPSDRVGKWLSLRLVEPLARVPPRGLRAVRRAAAAALAGA